jgi:hypothetical protein
MSDDNRRVLMLVLILRNYNALEKHTFEQWSAILDLSTRWDFANIRDLAIRCIRSPDPLKKLILARKHNIDMWIQPALLELCLRPRPLGREEAHLMDFEDVMLVCSVRQTARSSTLSVDGTGIRNCIQAWQNSEPWSPVTLPAAGPSSVPVPLGWPASAPQHTPADEWDFPVETKEDEFAPAKKKKGKKR